MKIEIMLLNYWVPNSISSENNPRVLPFSSSSSSSSNTSSSSSSSFYNINPTNNNWLIFDKYHQNSEKCWSKNRELFEKKFIEEFGTVKGSLLPNSVNWFQYDLMSHINISFDWWLGKQKIIDNYLQFKIIRKLWILHNPIDINFKPKHDLSKANI
jgi:hypothetical protein